MEKRNIEQFKQIYGIEYPDDILRLFYNSGVSEDFLEKIYSEGILARILKYFKGDRTIVLSTKGDFREIYIAPTKESNTACAITFNGDIFECAEIDYTRFTNERVQDGEAVIHQINKFMGNVEKTDYVLKLILGSEEALLVCYGDTKKIQGSAITMRLDPDSLKLIEDCAEKPVYDSLEERGHLDYFRIPKLKGVNLKTDDQRLLTSAEDLSVYEYKKYRR